MMNLLVAHFLKPIMTTVFFSATTLITLLGGGTVRLQLMSTVTEFEAGTETVAPTALAVGLAPTVQVSGEGLRRGVLQVT